VTPSSGRVEDVFRDQAGRVLATLIRLLGDFELAEDAMQEAFTAALEQWPAEGVPANPRAWLVNVGRHKAIDRLRRRIHLRAIQQQLAQQLAGESEVEAEADPDPFGDDLLRLIFTCCHPSLGMETRVALTLHTVCGLSTQAVARSFLVNEDTMAQRLVRAKSKIREAGIPYQTPAGVLIDERVDGVLAVIYLVFTEGYSGGSEPEPEQAGLSTEAIRLGQLLNQLLPERPAAQGLLALMLLHDSRRGARSSASGDIILLEHQDRSLWDGGQIAQGLRLLELALRVAGPPSSYVIQAAIAALHARAQHYDKTDWPQIVGLYQVLLRLHPSPVIELNHAAAVAMTDGPECALDLVDALAARGDLELYHLLPAVRADLLRRLGRRDEARTAYRLALGLARAAPERRLLAHRLAESS
jgi:RNA polymerase sigma-70 factor (ECF subfamily)